MRGIVNREVRVAEGWNRVYSVKALFLQWLLQSLVVYQLYLLSVRFSLEIFKVRFLWPETVLRV